MTDPIADLLTRIRNSSQAQKRYCDIPLSIIKENVVKILKKKGFIYDYKVIEEDKKKSIRVFLKYTHDRKPVIKLIKRMSKPGLRKYVNKDEIPTVLGGIGISIISTSMGVIDGEEARKKQVGGELLCIAW